MVRVPGATRPGTALERLPAQRAPLDSYRLGAVQPPSRASRAHPSAHRAPATGRGWRWLLVIPICMAMLTPIYNRVEPELWGMPFFYWYQLGCAVVAIVVTTLVFLLTREPG